MTSRGERLVHLVWLLAIAALVALNALLVGLNLQKHQLFPFEEPSPSSGAPAQAASTSAARSEPELEIEAFGADSTAVGTAIGDPQREDQATEDDWPGGHGPVPDGPPSRRRAAVTADGTIELTGSVPSWAVASQIAAVAGSRIPGGIGSVAIDYSWHPDASDQITAGEVVFEPSIRYDAGQVTLPPTARPDLDLVVGILDSNPEVFAAVVAHVDDFGDTPQNAAVAMARTTGVVAYLESQGIDQDRLIVTVAPEASTEPVNDTEAQRAFNRRVEIQFRNFLTPLSTG